MLTDSSIYNEVYKIIKSNPHFIRNMSVVDKQALDEKSDRKLEEIRESIKNWTYSCERSPTVTGFATNAVPKLRLLRKRPLVPSTKGAYPTDRDQRVMSRVTQKVYIKKSNGRLLTRNVTKLRPLSIPSLNDIILQTAIKLLIEPECEEKIFNKQSFGFRPNRSVHHALHSVMGMVGVT